MIYTDPQLKAITAHQDAGLPLSSLKLPAPAARRKMSREESQMQIALLKWWQMQCRVFGVPELLLFSIPNGGGRSGPVVGSILKAEGLRKGAPDLFLAVYSNEPHEIQPRHYYGLFLELKRRDGALSPEQKVFHQLLRHQGYRVEVVYSLVGGINVITSYLNK